LISAELGPEGVRQVWGPDGLPQLAAPLQWRRWRDHGEFWDAWDLAGNYRDHPLALEWLAGPTLVEQGPLCSRLVWRGRAGQSALRLDVQLRAGCPWLELSLSVDWRQQHELLRLELPLAQAISRYAADTSGGVLERPAAAVTPREQARWEVPAISWIASQGQAGGLAVLLEGPQGVSAQPDQLGVSLLRAPTWPDPSADNGYQRLRLALLPCPGGWRQAAVPQQAVRFREPVWLRAQLPGDRQVEPAQVALPSALWLGNAALQLVGLRPDPKGEAGVALLTVQNLSPLRQVLELPHPWCLLDGPFEGWLKPWQLLSLRVGRAS
jgi:alpha-mannosidase